MAFNQNFTNLNSLSPSNWLAYLCHLDSATLDQMSLEQVAFGPTLAFSSLDPMYQYEDFSLGPLVNTRPTDDNESETRVTASSTPLPTVPSPPNWREIPQRDYKTNDRHYLPSEPILFNVNGALGLNMGDALHDIFAGLEGRDDFVLRGAKSVFSCRFLFPGYPDGSYQIFTMRWNKDRDPIMRSKLGHEVAKCLKKYLDAMATQTMDTSTAEHWEIGKGFMRLENMFLVKLQPVSAGSYQPQFYVKDPMV